MKRLAELLKKETEKRVKLLELPPECKEAVRVLELKQGFILEIREDDKARCDVRVRQAREEGKPTAYTMTAKFRPLNQEAETAISKELFNELWPRTERKQEKRRYLLESGWSVDELSTGAVFAEFEYEKNKGRSSDMPEGFKEAKE